MEEIEQMNNSPGIRLEGTRIMATGALGALGSTFCKAAAKCGAALVLLDHCPSSIDAKTDFIKKKASVLADLGTDHDVRYYDCDITDERSVPAILREVDSDQGRIDVIVNFAGRHHRVFDLASDDIADMANIFRDVIELNLTGAFIVTAAAARVMVPRRTGHIIHLCSSGSRASLYGSYAYNASKHGVEGIVKTAAAQLAPFGVRVNGVAPGTVITDLARTLIMTPDGDYLPRAKSILAHTPTKRFITAEGVAETILGLCFPQRHLTGNVVFCDDGYNVEGHSWPDGNIALYAGSDSLDRLYRELDEKYPRSEQAT